MLSLTSPLVQAFDMVIYDFQCATGHRFEGWFPTVKAYTQQKRQRLIACSVCGCSELSRIPAGGHVASAELAPSTSALTQKNKIYSESAHDLPFDPVLLFKAIGRQIHQTHRDVGHDFSDMAVRMNKGEIPHEPIRGKADEDQRELLDHEGVEYVLVPKLSDKYEN